MSTTGQSKYRDAFAPVVPGVEFVKFNDVEDLKQKFSDSVCAVALEVVQGEGGIQPVTRDFLETARALTAGSGALLIIDEIQSGLGRTGEWFAFQHYGITPDVLTVAKPIAGGLALGAVLTTNQAASCLKPGMHGSTFGGGPLACAVACTVLDEIEKRKLIKSNRELGKYFVKQLEKLKTKQSSLTVVRGLGLMVAAELGDADLAKATVSAMLERGIIINRTHDTSLRFLPPYTISKKHINQVVEALDATLKQLEKTHKKSQKKSHAQHAPEPELVAQGSAR
jgi:acetylornithine aminotransferase/acetylornithine/N-succinyldiaminopimelate aminotransferase